MVEWPARVKAVRKSREKKRVERKRRRSKKREQKLRFVGNQQDLSSGLLKRCGNVL